MLSAIRNTPIENATIDILYTGEPSSVIDELKTDANGLTPEITLPAPPLEYSMEPSEYQPYAEYTFHIEAEDFEPLDISGAEILPEVTALQTARLQAQTPENTFQNIVIPAHTLFGTYPEKYPKTKSNPWTNPGRLF